MVNNEFSGEIQPGRRSPKPVTSSRPAAAHFAIEYRMPTIPDSLGVHSPTVAHGRPCESEFTNKVRSRRSESRGELGNDSGLTHNAVPQNVSFRKKCNSGRRCVL